MKTDSNAFDVNVNPVGIFVDGSITNLPAGQTLPTSLGTVSFGTDFIAGSGNALLVGGVQLAGAFADKATWQGGVLFHHSAKGLWFQWDPVTKAWVGGVPA